eukprot:9095206-Pyramimonas_sp.AAC.1
MAFIPALRGALQRSVTGGPLRNALSPVLGSWARSGDNALDSLTNPFSSAPFSTSSGDDNDNNQETPSRPMRQRPVRPANQAEYNRELSNLTKFRNK